jgi:dTMP kinase
MEERSRKNMKRFVTFEGIDGSGKTTVAKLVYKQLQSDGYKVVLTYEPTNTWIGKRVQQCIRTACDPYVTTFTFIADRMEHCKKIQQQLEQGYIVLCDRYAESTYAYQAVQLQKRIQNPIFWLKELSQNRILTPDITFIFDLDPSLALTRIQHRKQLIPFERVAFLEEVRKNYLSLIDGPRFVKINATQSKEVISEQCYNRIIS